MKLFPACLALACAMMNAADTTSSHLKSTHEHSLELALAPAEAFTFFEPIGEKRWAAGWNPVFVTPDDARLHDGSVFTVERPGPPGRSPTPSVWTITRYEPPRAIEYHNVLIGQRTSRISVRLAAVAPGRTRVTVRYTYTGLSAEGDAAIREITPDSYRANIESWGTEIAAYLERGTPASP